VDANGEGADGGQALPVGRIGPHGVAVLNLVMIHFVYVGFERPVRG
jgi:hypothetical protein